MAGAAGVRGFRELERAFAAAGKQTNAILTTGLREVAEPVRRDATALAVEKIPHIGVAWSQMRIGVTRKSVYVAPKQRGLKTRGDDPRRRPNLAGLLMDRALQPALDRNEGQIDASLERLFDEVADRFNRGG